MTKKPVPATDTMIGLFGHLFNTETNNWDFQFEIVSRQHEIFYLVKLFSAIDGYHKGDLRILTFDQLRDYHRCQLYSDRERWIEQVEVLNRNARAQKKAQQRPMLWADDKGNIYQGDAEGKPLP